MVQSKQYEQGATVKHIQYFTDIGNFNMDLRKTIKDSMAEQQITIPKLARRIDCNHMTLYNYFAGRTALSADRIEKIMDVLGLSLS